MKYIIKTSSTPPQIPLNILIRVFQYIKVKEKINMKTKDFIRFFCITCGLIILLMYPVSTIPAHAADISSQTAASEGETIEPRAPIIGWVYKEENGKNTAVYITSQPRSGSATGFHATDIREE